MKLLIVGAKGQLGSSIVNLIKNTDIDYLSVGKNELDISIEHKVLDYLQGNKPDVVINCAAYTAVDLAEDNSDIAFEVNSIGPENLAKACKLYGLPLIHVSTDYVFSGESPVPYTEMCEVNPINVYGKSKFEGEEYIRTTLKEHIIIRVSWLYSEFGNNFMKTMLRLANERENLSIVSDQIGSPTYAGDLASLIIYLSNQLTNRNFTNFGLYHFSNKGACSWFEFAQEIFKKAQEIGYLDKVPKLSPINTNAYPTRAKRPMFSKLDTSKAELTFGVKIPHWSQSLTTALIHLSSNHE